jgi:hypothetical protein
MVPELQHLFYFGDLIELDVRRSVSCKMHHSEYISYYIDLNRAELLEDLS